MRLIKMFSALTALVGLCVSAHAEVVVDFNVNQVTNGTAFGSSFALADLNLAATNYSGAAMKGAYNEVGGNNYRVEVAGGQGASVRTGDGQTASGMWAWKTAATSAFAAGFDTLTADLRLTTANIAPDGVDYRFVVENAGSWFISETVATKPATATSVAISTNALSLDWFDYDPSTVAGVTNFGSTVVSATTFTDMDYIGAYLSVTGLDASKNYGIKDLTATAIPEPATLGLIAAFGSAILFIRRRFIV
jgi:hypothetical protein